MSDSAKAWLKWAGTIGLLLAAPIWLPVCFVIYEIPWREMGQDLVKFHDALWGK